MESGFSREVYVDIILGDTPRIKIFSHCIYPLYIIKQHKLILKSTKLSGIQWKKYTPFFDEILVC